MMADWATDDILLASLRTKETYSRRRSPLGFSNVANIMQDCLSTMQCRSFILGDQKLGQLFLDKRRSFPNLSIIQRRPVDFSCTPA